MRTTCRTGNSESVATAQRKTISRIRESMVNRKNKTDAVKSSRNRIDTVEDMLCRGADAHSVSADMHCHGADVRSVSADMHCHEMCAVGPRLLETLSSRPYCGNYTGEPKEHKQTRHVNIRTKRYKHEGSPVEHRLAVLELKKEFPLPV